MAVITQHEDFGEKIGGARKDLWQKRGLYSGDLDGMNVREADKYVRKDYVWKKPDYQALIDNGLPVDVAYFIKTIRDSLETAPSYKRSDDSPEKRLDRQRKYIDAVREIQAVVEDVKTKEDVLSVFKRCMVAPGYVERSRSIESFYSYSVTAKGRENPLLSHALTSAMYFQSASSFDVRITQEAAVKQFGVPKDQKTPTGYSIRFNDGKNSFSKNESWNPNTWYVTKGVRILQSNFESREAALKWVQDYARQQRTGGKTKFVPPQLEEVQREGSDYRHDHNAEGQDFINTFGFKGGEYGNWMSQLDRQGSLDMGFDALKDLAAALKISDRDISYQGELSIAFGARGSGNAVAHYEPMRQVINLTKLRGAGSLAHEWWHGLDDFLGKKLGANGMLSENPHKYPPFEKLIDAIQFKPETAEQAAARAASADSRTKGNADGCLKTIMMPTIDRAGSEEAKEEFEALRGEYLQGIPGSVNKLSDLKKRLTGRIIPKEDREQLYIFERILGQIAERVGSEPSIGKTRTDFFLASRRMGDISEKDGGYWDSNTEMTARAFATYVMDRLPGRSDYLVGHAECAVGWTADKDGNPEIVKAFPQGAEREAINAVFDELVAELKLGNFLTHDEHELPKPAQVLSSDRPVATVHRPARVSRAEMAKGVDLVSFIHAMGYQTGHRGHEHYLVEHDSLKISNNKWYWHSQGIGGTAIDFAMHFPVRHGRTVSEAIDHVLNVTYGKQPVVRRERIELQTPDAAGNLSLPKRSDNPARMFAYLSVTRGIDRQILQDAYKAGTLYQSAGTNNCVFVGADAEGVAQYGFQRGTLSEKRFVRDCDGSDKSYGFSMPAKGNTDTVCVYESPIDAMSHATLEKRDGQLYDCVARLSLGGVSGKALERYLDEHPHIQKVVLCLDNDEAGQSAAVRIRNQLSGRAEFSVAVPKNKDWNLDLKALQREPRVCSMELL
jgi:hypothetical protein